MKPAEYLDAAKARLLLSSDYALAKKIGIPQGHVAEMRNGKRPINAYVATWVAITLELDPATVIADIEAQREKNPARAEFWRSFLARAVMLAAIMGTLGSISSDFSGTEQSAVGGAMVAASAAYLLALRLRRRPDNVHYVKS